MLRRPMHRLSLLLGAATVLLVLVPSAARAGESPFGWLYTADVQPPRTFELEHWSWLQHGQAGGQYDYVINKEELEYGITNRFQISGYFNWSYVNAIRNEPDGATGGPGTDIAENADPSGRFTRTRFDSVAVELLYLLLNPLTDPFGLAFYVEPEVGPDVAELELRLIAQKNFLDDRLILALNFWTAFETENTEQGVERATALELDFGVSYRFAPGWSAGIEGRNHREFVGHGYGTPEHSAWFVGPNIHYATQRWWVTVAYRHQLPVVETYNEDQETVTRHGRIFGDEHARDEFIVKIGIPF
jgi:hypothetical protein